MILTKQHKHEYITAEHVLIERIGMYERRFRVCECGDIQMAYQRIDAWSAPSSWERNLFVEYVNTELDRHLISNWVKISGFTSICRRC